MLFTRFSILDTECQTVQKIIEYRASRSEHHGALVIIYMLKITRGQLPVTSGEIQNPEPNDKEHLAFAALIFYTYPCPNIFGNDY